MSAKLLVMFKEICGVNINSNSIKVKIETVIVKEDVNDRFSTFVMFVLFLYLLFKNGVTVQIGVMDVFI